MNCNCCDLYCIIFHHYFLYWIIFLPLQWELGINTELMQKLLCLGVGNFCAGRVQAHFRETKSKSTPWAERKDRLFPLKLEITCRAALHLSQQTKSSSSLKGTVGIYAKQWIMCFLLSQSLDFTTTEIPNKSADISVGDWRDLH